MQGQQRAARQTAQHSARRGRRRRTSQVGANCSPGKGTARAAGYMGSHGLAFGALEQVWNVPKPTAGAGRALGRSARSTALQLGGF